MQLQHTLHGLSGSTQLKVLLGKTRSKRGFEQFGSGPPDQLRLASQTTTFDERLIDDKVSGLHILDEEHCFLEFIEKRLASERTREPVEKLLDSTWLITHHVTVRIFSCRFKRWFSGSLCSISFAMMLDRFLESPAGLATQKKRASRHGWSTCAGRVAVVRKFNLSLDRRPRSVVFVERYSKTEEFLPRECAP